MACSWEVLRDMKTGAALQKSTVILEQGSDEGPGVEAHKVGLDPAAPADCLCRNPGARAFSLVY